MTAKYAGEDAGNYEVESVEITLTRKACTHPTTKWIVDKEATVDAEGSRHKECRSARQFLIPRRLRSSKHKHRMLPFVTQPMYRHTVGRVMRTMQTSGLQMARWQALPVRQSDWKVLR